MSKGGSWGKVCAEKDRVKHALLFSCLRRYSGCSKHHGQNNSWTTEMYFIGLWARSTREKCWPSPCLLKSLFQIPEWCLVAVSYKDRQSQEFSIRHRSTPGNSTALLSLLPKCPFPNVISDLTFSIWTLKRKQVFIVPQNTRNVDFSCPKQPIPPFSEVNWEFCNVSGTCL